ncbi:hypothetical protein K438DRAFT_1461224, partial [Mycena galopus ATCC 62051]
DSLGIPYSEDKQVFGTELVIIGFLVDSRTMRVMIPEEAHTAFISKLRHWTSVGQWQALAGYSNSVFNALPLLEPALCNVYTKMEGKDRADAPIYVNEAVCRDLSWLTDHVESNDGIYFIKSV